MTEKQKEACRLSIKMWKWLAVNTVKNGIQKYHYFEKFPAERVKLDSRLSRQNDCFLCGNFSCIRYVTGKNGWCPLDDCSNDHNPYCKWSNYGCPVFAFLIADTVERALNEATGVTTTKSVYINKGVKE